MADTARSAVTAQDDDFARWYHDVVANAGVAEEGPARGTTIIKPWGFAICERIQADLDTRIRATGADNASFPLLVPEDFPQPQARRVAGADHQLAVVARGGDDERRERLVVHPTSAAVVGDAMSRWIQGYRDLPLKLNQWSGAARWELNPWPSAPAGDDEQDTGTRGTTADAADLLWQEGHTAHATASEAIAEARRVLTGVYEQVLRDVLAIPVHAGRKTRRGTAAGAEVTYTLEALLRDGGALQLGASHYMGSNVARAFGIRFLDQTGHRRHAHTTSWGLSSVAIGALIMTHGDDRGLRLPPRVAPVQVVVLALTPEAAGTCERLAHGLAAAGLRVEREAGTAIGVGRRAREWELKGVPVRIEVGPRDLAARQAMVVRRDRAGKQPYPLPGLLTSIPRLLEDIQRSLYGEAQRRRDAMTDVVPAVTQVGGAGSFLVPWERVGDDAEATLAERGFTVRCLLTRGLAAPAHADDRDLLAWVARAG